MTTILSGTALAEDTRGEKPLAWFPAITCASHGFLEELNRDGVQYAIVPADGGVAVWEVDR